jgi:site-specific DNA-methyltransferase (adenine-specific)
VAEYQLFNGDCLEVMPTLEAGSVDALISDPPYGMNLRTDYKDRKRGALAVCNNFAPIAGDDKPFDPAPFLGFPVVVLFGANYYADRLPVSGAWLVWDKLDGLQSKRDIGFNDNSDCELAWTNRGKAVRIIRHRWMGAMKASEHSARRVHPTQKPVAMMEAIIRYYTREGDLVLDPFMGSGTTGIACLNTGRRFIGIERDAGYFATAQERMAKAAASPRQEPLELERAS